MRNFKELKAKMSKVAQASSAKRAATILATIQPESNRPKGAFTQMEYASENNVSKSTALRAIQKLAEAGRIRRVKFRAQEQGTGNWRQIWGWELVSRGSER